jgi:hypothetical protein
MVNALRKAAFWVLGYDESKTDSHILGIQAGTREAPLLFSQLDISCGRKGEVNKRNQM